MFVPINFSLILFFFFFSPHSCNNNFNRVTKLLVDLFFFLPLLPPSFLPPPLFSKFNHCSKVLQFSTPLIQMLVIHARIITLRGQRRGEI